MEKQNGIEVHRPENLIKAETLLGYILRYGVLLCGVVIACGVILSFVHPGPAGPRDAENARRVLQGEILSESPVPQSAGAFVAAVEGGDPQGIIALGLLMLIALPVIRVAFTVFLFLFERDYIYLAITSVVLVILLSGIFLGKAL